MTRSTSLADAPIAGPAPEAPKGLVPAVARAARLLELLAVAKQPVKLAHLPTRLGLPKSSVHALCATLVYSGLVTRYEDGSYHLGVRVMDLAHAFLARTDLTTDFARILETMKPMPEESIVLSVLDGAEIVYIACRNGTRPFGFNFRYGMRLPANCTASGKAQLASLPPETVAALAHDHRFPALTARSVTELEPLQRQLALVRRRGYAVDNEETRIGMICIGAPVFEAGARGTAVAAVGLSMPKAALDAEQSAAAIRAVRDVAAALSKRLGGG
jgi:IclR family transcriptional regulator, blcABC operon repressor